jgi:hypothetical protein
LFLQEVLRLKLLRREQEQRLCRLEQQEREQEREQQ